MERRLRAAEHAPWHGLTFTDFIFPAFLWIVGVSMSLSFGRRMQAGAAPHDLLRHAARRAAIIFALGLVLAAFPFGLLPAHSFSLGTLRIPGVLQRIAVCYLAASAICLYTNLRGQLAWTAALLALYALALQYIPVPGFGAGHLAPLGNLAWWVDSHALAGHTWAGAPAPGFDPEGILSTLPAIATTLCGALVGHGLRVHLPGSAHARRLLLGGVALLAAGALLGFWQPINKNLWTSSFALVTAGGSTLAFALLYWIIDVHHYRRWATPFVIYGLNAIVMFVLAGVIGRLLGLVRWTSAGETTVTLKGFLYANFFAPFAGPLNASLLFALAFVAMFFLLAWAMWKQRWFIKI